MNQTPKGLIQKKTNGVVLQNFPGYFLIASLLISLVLLYFLWQPFWISLILAGIFASALYPLYDRLLKLTKGRARLSALLACLFVLFLIVIPTGIFLFLLGRQALDVYNGIVQKVQSGALDPYLKWEQGNIFYDIFQEVQTYFEKSQVLFGTTVDLTNLDLKQSLVGLAKDVSGLLVGQTKNLIAGLGESFLNAILNFFILFFALYYFFKDGHLISNAFMQASPLPAKYNTELLRKFKEMSKAALYGIFLTSIAQGMLGGIGFMIVGIPNALLWGTAMAFFSLVPLVGTSLIWLPASVILLLSGNIFGGIFLFLWGIFLVGTIDNFLRAYLIGNRVKMNPLLAFLAVFGGIGLFGLVGVLFGPLILTLFFTFLHIYELEYKTALKK